MPPYLLFRFIKPSSQASPGTCISITAVAEPLFSHDGSSQIYSSQQWIAATQICEAPLHGAPAPFTLVFDAATDSTKYIAQQLVVKFQASQKVSAPSNMELRWSGVVSLPVGHVGHLHLDMQEGKLYPQNAPPSKRLKHPKPPAQTEDHALSTRETNSTAVECAATILQHPSTPEGTSLASTATLAAAALISLAAGVISGRVFFARIDKNTKKNTHLQKKETCEIACSPFVMAESPRRGARGRRASRLKWTRDPDGRLQRDGIDGDNGHIAEREGLEDLGAAPNREE